MKVDFLAGLGPVPRPALSRCSIRSDGDPLSDIWLDRGGRLEDELRAILERRGVRCHQAPDPAMPGMDLVRAALLVSPWGIIRLRPAAGHHAGDIDRAFDFARSLGAPPAAYIRRGTIDGRDIAIVRPGLVAIGCSRHTDREGAEALAEIFGTQGWDVVVGAVDPAFGHLDALLCMLSPDLALARPEGLDPDLRRQLERREIAIVAHGDAEGDGGAILPLGAGSVVSAAGNERLNRLLEERGVAVELVEGADPSEGFRRVGLPLARRTG